MPYQVRITETARRAMLRLPGHVRQRVRHLVEALAADPAPAGSRELRGAPGRYRLPLLQWRIIYHLDREAETVLVLTIRRKTGPETYQDIEE